ncbi:hypothetical protein EDB86DRAFT_2839119 [Lactarius hatsudake]|nr:hypothetical protein EDB86DRAFT_2839119 [Lactarius hatsudake]
MEMMLSPSMILSAPSESVPPLRPFPFHYGLCCEANSCLSLRLFMMPSQHTTSAFSVFDNRDPSWVPQRAGRTVTESLSECRTMIRDPCVDEKSLVLQIKLQHLPNHVILNWEKDEMTLGLHEKQGLRSEVDITDSIVWVGIEKY